MIIIILVIFVAVWYLLVLLIREKANLSTQFVYTIFSGDAFQNPRNGFITSWWVEFHPLDTAWGLRILIILGQHYSTGIILTRFSGQKNDFDNRLNTKSIFPHHEYHPARRSLRNRSYRTTSYLTCLACSTFTINK